MYQISRSYWLMVYLFTLYLSLFGLPSSLLHPLPHSLRLAFSVPPGEPWPGISNESSLSSFIPELAQKDKVRLIETKIKQKTRTIWSRQRTSSCPSFLLSSYCTILLLLNNCRGGIHYSFFCILREKGFGEGKLDKSEKNTTGCIH